MGALTLLKKLGALRGKYPNGPELHETATQAHDAWANMTLRYTKDDHAKKHNAGTHMQESKCETGIISKPKRKKIHQSL